MALLPLSGRWEEREDVREQKEEEGAKPVATTADCYQQEASYSGPAAKANFEYECVLIQHEQREAQLQFLAPGCNQHYCHS